MILPDQINNYPKIEKTGGSSDLFLPENDFKTCSLVNFPKNIQILEAWKPTMKFRLNFFFSHVPLHMNSTFQGLIKNEAEPLRVTKKKKKNVEIPRVKVIKEFQSDLTQICGISRGGYLFCLECPGVK